MAFPTETVYGLGACALDPDAVARVFAAKGRPADNPLIVHVADVAGLERLVARVPPLALDLAARFWPGPLTLVCEAAPSLPRQTTGGLATVAVRVPAHPVALALLRAADVPVAAPSANRSGRPSPTTAAMAHKDLPEVEVVLDGGPCAVGLESTVVDCTSTPVHILRPGAVTAEMLQSAGIPVAGEGSASDYRSPGTRHAHYRPRARVFWVESTENILPALKAAPPQSVGLLTCGNPPAPWRDHPAVARVDAAPNLQAYARSLYRAFADMDAAGCERIIAVLPPAEGLGVALRDRLQRAGEPLVVPEPS